MLDLYMRRTKGEAISREATELTRNQVYWYGIFNDIILKNKMDFDRLLKESESAYIAKR